MTTTLGGHACQYTGDNLNEIVDLGVHVVAHPTQDAVIVFARDGALDPVGVLAPGQTVIVNDGGVLIAGIPDRVSLPPLPDDALFDPARSHVAEVLEYLRNLDDQAEIDRVLAAERAGKARKSIVGAPPAPEDLPTPRMVPDPVDAALTVSPPADQNDPPADQDHHDHDPAE